MISDRTSAILLLTSYFSKDLSNPARPLSISEWNTFANWLVLKKMNPEDLFLGEDKFLDGWNHNVITKSRLTTLLDRKASLAISLDKWTKAGIWILNRSEDQYPKKISEKLKIASPPIIFGVGDQNLLNHEYIGIVGSRDVDELDKINTYNIAKSTVNQRFGIVSGGAKGIDEFAMFAALESGGECVAILSDSLLKRSTSPQLRPHIVSKKLVLISPYNPEVGFNVGNAMGRNKLIYTLSNLSIVVKSDVKGGTWSGAKENLFNSWVPVFVYKPIVFSNTGNHAIQKLGGNWLPTPDNFVIALMLQEKSYNAQEKNLFSIQEDLINLSPSHVNKNINLVELDDPGQSLLKKDNLDLNLSLDLSLFQFFILKSRNNFKRNPFTKDDVIEKNNISSKQADEWLNLAVQNNIVKKKTKPVSFQFNF